MGENEKAALKAALGGGGSPLFSLTFLQRYCERPGGRAASDLSLVEVAPLFSHPSEGEAGIPPPSLMGQDLLQRGGSELIGAQVGSPSAPLGSSPGQLVNMAFGTILFALVCPPSPACLSSLFCICFGHPLEISPKSVMIPSLPFSALLLDFSYYTLPGNS